MTAETEINLILQLLKLKYPSYNFSKRIALDGYLDAPRYRLVINGYSINDESIFIYGDKTDDIFQVNDKFVEHYWLTIDKHYHQDTRVLTTNSLDDYLFKAIERSSVATCRDEFLLKVAALNIENNE